MCSCRNNDPQGNSVLTSEKFREISRFSVRFLTHDLNFPADFAIFVGVISSSINDNEPSQSDQCDGRPVP